MRLKNAMDFLLQIILLKIYDEQAHAPNNSIMVIQDFSTSAADDDTIIKTCNAALGVSVGMFQKYIGKKRSTKRSLYVAIR